MWFRNLFDYLASTPSRTPASRARRVASRRRPAATRLQLEALEDRCLLSFSPAVSYPVGGSPQAMVTGDFNGDGRVDLAVANSSVVTGQSNVSILPAKADGTFQAAQNSATGDGPISLAVGDFNGDGKLDLVTASSPDVSALLGNGNGTFQAPHRIGLPGQFPPGYTGSTALPQIPFSVAVADLNGDGKLDLAVSAETVWTNAYTHVDGYSNVLLGNGDGSFTPKAAYHLDLSGTDYPPALGVGDFNGDRKLDLAAVAPGGSGVNVLLGNGDGTLQAPVHSASGTPFAASPGVSVVTGDLNGDGKLDLMTRSSGNRSVLVQKGNGDGTFQAPQTLNVGLPPAPGYFTATVHSVVLGDVNGDGKLDLTVLTSETRYETYGYYGNYNPTTTSYANVLLGHGDGSFGQPISSTLGVRAGFDYYSAATLVDVNGDGRPDLAASDSAAYSVSVALNDGNWSTTPQASSFTVSGFPSSTTAGAAGGFTVTAKNTDGTTATGYTGAVHFSSSDGQAVLPADYTFTAADGGVHAFSVTLKTAGTQALTATDTTTGSITGSEAGITVNPAAASTMTVAGFPSATTAGVAGRFTVTLKDPYGNIASGYTGTVHFKSSDGKASLPANYTFTAADAGVHAFIATLKTAGTQSLTGTDATTTSLTGTDGGITVKPAAASRFLIRAPSSVRSGAAFSLTLTAQDAYGNVVTGYTGTIHFTSTDGSASLPANYTFTAADKGVHTFNGLVLRKKGTQKITLADTLNSALTGSGVENVV